MRHHVQGRSNALAERPVRATRELTTRKCFQVAVIVGCGRSTYEYDLSQEKLMGPALLAYCSIFSFSFEFTSPFADSRL